MTVKQLESMIAEVTADIRLYQQAKGHWIVLDPSSEAHRLCNVKLKLEIELTKARMWSND